MGYWKSKSKLSTEILTWPCVAEGMLKSKSKLSTEMLRSPCVADGILKPKSKLSTEMGNDSKTPDGLGWEVVFHSFTGKARKMWHRLFKLLPSHWMCSSCWSTVLHISFVFFFFFGGACWSTPHYLIWKPYSTLYYLTYKPYTVIAHHTI